MIYLGFFLLVVCFLFSHSILHDFFYSLFILLLFGLYLFFNFFLLLES